MDNCAMTDETGVPVEELEALADEWHDIELEWAKEGVERDEIWARAITYRKCARKVEEIIEEYDN